MATLPFIIGDPGRLFAHLRFNNKDKHTEYLETKQGKTKQQAKRSFQEKGDTKKRLTRDIKETDNKTAINSSGGSILVRKETTC
uniref:Uncharacterized protein n=1 Tax=Octopus bimaculoides TaxID=37653 RepID=A0A0L8G8H7_OCTBM